MTGYDSECPTPFLSDSGRAYISIRPIQQKELSAEELYRVCGREGLEIMFDDGVHGTICSSAMVDEEEINKVTHFRKAYSTDEWQPIDKIKDYMNE